MGDGSAVALYRAASPAVRPAFNKPRVIFRSRNHTDGGVAQNQLRFATVKVSMPKFDRPGGLPNLYGTPREA